MTIEPPRRVGWCPGALKPMASGDGLILRVKPRGATLSLAQAKGVTEVARRYGNGAIDITQRANLQLRGFEEGDLPAALSELDGLGLLDPSLEAEAVRNVLSSPLAGAHRSSICDICSIVVELESRLVRTPALHALPAKFSFLVDDGGRLGLAGVAADIRFEAFSKAGRPTFAVRLGGGEAAAAGLCAPEDVADVAEALARVFLDAAARDLEIRRMPALAERIGAASLLRRAGLSLGEAPRPREAVPADVIGTHDGVLGVAAPFGRLSASQFETLLAAAAAEGVMQLRLTPWRAILLPGLARLGEVRTACASAGLVVDAADPRLRVAACTGAPGCHRGTTAVLDHAAALAPWLGSMAMDAGIVLHVSGCSKGCAHAGQAPLTLVGHDGRYDLVVDGRAGDAPRLRGLGYDEAARCVAPSARMEQQA